MQQPDTRASGNRANAPLTATIDELAGPMPDITPARGSERRTRTNRSNGRRHERRRATPQSILTSIATDALKLVDSNGAVIHSVPPTEPGDPTLLFLRRDNQTLMMLAVPPEVIRSSRLWRGTCHPRDLRAEHQYEMMRVAEAKTPYLNDFDDHDETI